MKYTATFTKTDAGMYRAVLVDETTNPPQHTALECPKLIGLGLELGKTIEAREEEKLSPPEAH